MFLRAVSVIGMSSLLVACAFSPSPTVPMTVQTQQSLYVRWGRPDKVITLPNGHKRLMYRKVETQYIPKHITPGYAGATVQGGKVLATQVPTTVIGGGSYERVCTTWFEVNKQGRIIDQQQHGNGC